MALTKCRECKKEVAKSAPTCPHCGVKNPGQHGVQISTGAGCLILIALIMLFGTYYGMSGEGTSATRSVSTASNRTTPAVPRRVERWAHNAVNVRGGRGTNHPVVGQLTRGERVEVDSLTDGWFVVYRGGQRLGYVAASVLESQPIPAFEVVSWNWQKDPGFAGRGAVIWTVEVRNNTARYVNLLRVDFTTYDAAGNVIDSDYGYVEGLSPGGVRSLKGYATYFGREERARIQLNP